MKELFNQVKFPLEVSVIGKMMGLLCLQDSYLGNRYKEEDRIADRQVITRRLYLNKALIHSI